MSSDTNPVPPRIRCEAILPTSSPSLACHSSHGAIVRSQGLDPGRPLADDPAVLIGFALCHARQGKDLTRTVPDTIIDRLRAHADHGNPACRMLLDWFAGRNRDLIASSHLDPDKPHSTKPRPGRHKRRQAGPGGLKRRKLTSTLSSNPKTAIIATKAEGRIDE